MAGGAAAGRTAAARPAGPLYGLLRLVGWEYALLPVEWYEIALFVAFWVLETRRTWPAWTPGSWPQPMRRAGR